MRRLLAMLLLASSAMGDGNWIGGPNLFVRRNSPTDPANGPLTMGGSIIHAGNSCVVNGVTVPCLTHVVVSGVWNTVSIAPYVPTSAIAVEIKGTPIITHGDAAETCDLRISFRATGESYNYVYGPQVIEPFINGGDRNFMSEWVPVRDGLFDYKLWWNTPGTWPSHCAYGVNLRIAAYLMP